MSEIENNCGTDCGCGPTTPKYWQDVEQKVLDPTELKAEFSEDFDSLSVSKNRRSFLKIMGFSVSALPLTGCIKIPVKKALPYLNKQNDVIPGVANWYSSTFENTPVLVKTREGRPIKIEGNNKAMSSMGGADARAQASVLSLYDHNRLRSAMVDGKDISWENFDQRLTDDLSDNGKATVIVTPSMTSPSELKLIKEFKAKFNATHVAYEAYSDSAAVKANKVTHGANGHNEYDFERADVIVSFNADFLGTWGNSVGNAKRYSKRRDVNYKHPEGKDALNRHYQIEQTMSMTGMNADYRYTRSHMDQENIMLGLYSKLSGYQYKVADQNKEIVDKMYNDLQGAKGRSLVVCGCNEVAMQVLCNKINALLGNYGTTVKAMNYNNIAHADDAEFVNLVTDMNNGKVGAVFFVGVNPGYDYFDSKAFAAGLAKVDTKVCMTTSANETTALCNYVAASNHSYESWSDALVASNEVSFTQPVIQPLFGTRMWTESLMKLLGKTEGFYDYMKSFWSTQGINWNQALHDGVVATTAFASEASETSFDVNKYINELKAHKSNSGMNIFVYQKVGIGNGNMAENPWLQELPDPVTKATWDNYVMVSPSYAKDKGLKTGDIVKVSTDKAAVELPVMVQPGTEKNTIAIAVGYGREVASKTAKGRGANAFKFVSYHGSSFNYARVFGSMEKTGKSTTIAQTQTHHSMYDRNIEDGPRDIVRETTYSAFKSNPKSGNEVKKPKTVHIYPEHSKTGHQWAMSVDLNKCTGCSACIVSCNAENNVPVVGKEEVLMRREMHWIRLDRYYSGDDNQPEVVNMPMLCQHCENAPCENVCPVMATLHSHDGINQQVYNRCVGTRYCANNCPYKVRRFNWFNYKQESDVERMVLNPDVSIRKRGIMEKCSLCIQRIQEGKLTAKRERRNLKDGDIQLACQQSCPSEAIVFGDMNDDNSNISKIVRLERANRYKDPRGYEVLEEINVQPRINYLTKIRNK